MQYNSLRKHSKAIHLYLIWISNGHKFIITIYNLHGLPSFFSVVDGIQVSSLDKRVSCVESSFWHTFKGKLIIAQLYRDQPYELLSTNCDLPWIQEGKNYVDLSPDTPWYVMLAQCNCKLGSRTLLPSQQFLTTWPEESRYYPSGTNNRK